MGRETPGNGVGEMNLFETLEQQHDQRPLLLDESALFVQESSVLLVYLPEQRHQVSILLQEPQLIGPSLLSYTELDELGAIEPQALQSEGSGWRDRLQQSI